MVGYGLTSDHYHTYDYRWQSDSMYGDFNRVLSLSRKAITNDTEDELYDTLYTVTIPTQLSSQQLSFYGPKFVFHGPENPVQATWTTQAFQPVVLTACTHEFFEPDKVYYYAADGSRRPLPDVISFWEQLSKLRAKPDHESSMYDPAMWISSSGGSKSLLALYNLRDSIRICTVSSFWRTALTSLTIDDVGIVVRTRTLTSIGSMVNDDLKPIHINPEGINSLSQPCGFEGETDKIVSPGRLAICFATAISWIPGNDQNRTTDINSGNYLVKGSNQPKTAHFAPSTMFRIDKTIYGYGYGVNNISAKLSLAVVIAYAVVTFAYVVYTVMIGHTSTAWSSATELIMLALQSRDPGHLGHISVGLEKSETFQQSVGIRVSSMNVTGTGETTEKLELVFEHDQSSERRELSRIKRNKTY
jgi:hypothetical protein